MQTQTPESYQEFYGWYAIQVFVLTLQDGTFDTHGWIRHAIKNPTVVNDLPYEYPFDADGEKHLTADAALMAGIGLAREKIDGLK